MTLSIVALDPDTGQLGAAVHTGWLAVGNKVPWVETGVGAVLTQAVTEASYGPRSLDLLRSGHSPAEALGALLAEDPQAESRQVAIVDFEGRIAAHTGSACIASAGHALGDGVVAIANMAGADGVWNLMLDAFGNTTGSIARRLCSAVATGHEAGGDLRGSTSAALLTAPGGATEPAWARQVDLRIDDHPDPVTELARLLDLHEMYDLMGTGINAVTAGRADEAMNALEAAAGHPLANAQTGFWQAAAQLLAGDSDGAEATLRKSTGDDAGWRLLWERNRSSGRLTPPS
ncbi:MAG TPA: DUF1028 domain-containing protein [Acidimicrobiales bacterium]|nr:DUF1028 domain-containing protein [Acidimicrobiales bacterium]